jgi:Sap, sulfolipid-1-addressing protein
MLAEAAGLAVLAAISPTALLVAVVYLGSARPRRTMLSYLFGAVLMSAVMGVVVLVVLRVGGFSLPSRHTIRYELRLFLGLLLILAGLVLARFKRTPPDPGNPQSGLVSRLIASPAPYTAFLAGLLIFAPGITFIAAVQVVATAQASLELTAAALTLIVVINVALVWLPLLGYLAAPGPTTRWLVAFNEWLRRNGRLILAGALVAAGLIVAIDGLSGLLGHH